MQEKDRRILIYQVTRIELENQNVQAVAEGLIYFVLTRVQ